MTTVHVYTEQGDFVTCNDCGKVMLLPYGADRCPECGSTGTLSWTDEDMQEADIDKLLARHCNLHQCKTPEPEAYLSPETLVTEHVPYLVEKRQTARETLNLLNRISELYEKYEKENRDRHADNPYTPAIEALLAKLIGKLKEGDVIPIAFQCCTDISEFFHVICNEPPAKNEVSFSSDQEGNYYFNGRKVRVEHSGEFAYRLLKTKIQTSYERPVDFYFSFLARSGPYGTYGNPYYPSITDHICARYLKKEDGQTFRSPKQERAASQRPPKQQ